MAIPGSRCCPELPEGQGGAWSELRECHTLASQAWLHHLTGTKASREGFPWDLSIPSRSCNAGTSRCCSSGSGIACPHLETGRKPGKPLTQIPGTVTGTAGAPCAVQVPGWQVGNSVHGVGLTVQVMPAPVWSGMLSIPAVILHG